AAGSPARSAAGAATSFYAASPTRTTTAAPTGSNTGQPNPEPPTGVPQLTCDLVHDRGCWCRSAGFDLVQHTEMPSNTTLADLLGCAAWGRVGSGGVFVRTSTRRNRDGSKVSYLQLAHNEWDPTAKTSRTKVLYSFGRADQLDRAAIERLI